MATQVTLNSGSVDSAGSLALKTNGTTTAVTINASQGVEFNAGAVGTPSITTTGDTNTGIFFPAADTIAFSEGGVESMRIDSSGNVGIGSGIFGKGNGYAGNTTSSSTGTLDLYNYATGVTELKNSGSFPIVFATNNTERARIDSSGNLLFNSGYGSVATAYGCRAWVNFNGTGTVAIRDEGNVSSITDNGTGQYTLNFTTAMPDVNYCVTTSSGGGATTNPVALSYANRAVGSVQVLSFEGSNSTFDQANASVAIFR
jgi:hypothetical protein